MGLSESISIEINGAVVNIDKECVPMVEFFNSIGATTKYSCSGHGRNSFYIMFSDSMGDNVIESLLYSLSITNNNTLLIGKFYKWCRVLDGELTYNWIYEARTIKGANTDFTRLLRNC